MAWWGTFSFDLGECLHWQLANCSFYIERDSNQWRIFYNYVKEVPNNEIKIAEAIAKPTLENSIDNYYVLEKTTPHITVIPALANRSQVTRPEMPFYIAAHEQIILYVSSPIWARIETGKALRVLQEIPLQRLSDTWFGENTQEGELCYASLSRCRTQLDTSTLLPYRATTQIIIQNHRSENLLIQRIKLPLPFLSLFTNKDGNLWTETLSIEATSDGQISTTIEKTTPRFISHAKLLSNPRIVNKSKIFDLLESVWQ